MPEQDFLLMTGIIFVPTIFALALVFFPRGSDESMRWWALFGTALTLGLSLWAFILFYGHVSDANSRNNPGETTLEKRWEGLQRKSLNQPHASYDWMSKYEWIKQFRINYYLGVDGISMALVLLTTALSFLAMIASWKIDRYVKGYLILYLLLETGMLGTFLALDFFLFFIFWEVMLLPMYFLIGIWGGPRREYAAIKFFLYTMLGSVFILIALLGFYFTDVRDFLPQDVIKAEAERLKQGNPNLKGVPDREVEDRVTYNTFDLVLLQKVGRAAAQLIKGESGTAFAELDEARHELATASQSGQAEQLKAAEAKVAAATTHVVQVLKREKNDTPGLNDAVNKLDLASQAGKPEADLHAARNRVAAALDRLRQPFFTPTFQMIMFVLLFVGFAVKVPIVPFHTWLPDAHVEAPTPISMILAGVLLKMGGYGIIRIAYPICPWAAEYAAWWVALIGIISIVYGALAAMAQTDFKKLVAYSSVSHMGYVILGIAVWSAGDRSQYWQWGMNGAMFQMIAHGITSAGMFFLVGVIYDRAHHRNLDNFRGLYEPMPLYGGISAVIFFAAMGLPGMCGFVGEFFVVLATWNFSPVFSLLAALTVVITAAYILWTLQRVFLGVNPAYKGFPDIDWRELACVVPLVVLAVVLGVWPGLLLSWMSPAVNGLVDSLAQLTR
jgi:NADH-quinone oxidoreductase subunit M